MKYIEEKIKELEKEVALLKAKNKLQETKTSGFLKTEHTDHYVFNPSVNLLSEPDLETSFASPLDSSDMIKNSLDTITVNLSSITSDNLYNPDYIDSSDLPQYIPPYPDIIGSWDDKSYQGEFLSTFDTHAKNYLDYVDLAISTFDKKDKKVLENFKKNSIEQKIEKDFGKIISKFRILNHEWEMDGYGYIVDDYEEDNCSKKIITTDHNKPVVVNKSFFESKIKEYKEIIQETERALFLVK